MSNISSLWRRPYTLRRYSPEEYVDGHAVRSYEDVSVMLDVQFLGGTELQILPEGKRSEDRIRTYGNDVIRTADPLTGRPADRLLYQGYWWECEASVIRDKTILSHCRAQFVRVSEAVEVEESSLDPEAEEE